MPGLYKKRKRLTEKPSTRVEGGGDSSSHSSPSSAHDISVWHSTAINSSSGGGGGFTTSDHATPPQHQGDEEEQEEDTLLSLSPVKRPALGGAGALHPTPHRRRSQSQDSSPSSGPSSLAVIATPSAALNPFIQEEEEEDGDSDLFQDIDMGQPGGQRQGQKSRPPSPPPAPPKRKSPPAAATASGVGAAASSFPRPPLPPATAGSSRGHPNLDRSVHLSQRYGPVAIHPPSGHGFFSTTIHAAGFVLTLPKNHMYNDVLTFRTRMEAWMLEHTDEDSRIGDGATKFLKNMKKYFGVKDNLIHSTTTTLNDAECIQPSLLACLLGVPSLQTHLLEVVLPALSEATFSSAQEDVDFVSTVVSQMKWLPMLVDGVKFADDLLGILSTACDLAKKHIIRLLPEIFLPEVHPHLVPGLMTLFDAGTGVNVTMLDCFSCLVVPEQECIRIRSSAVEQMKSAPLKDLPAYFSFIFRVGSPPQQLEEGIREIREKLEIKSDAARTLSQSQNSATSSAPRKAGNNAGEDVLMVEILERIRFFVSVNPAIIKIWMSLLKDELIMEMELPTIDLLMLLIFVEASNKSASAMLMDVFTRPSLTLGLFERMMEHNNQMLHELFPTIARFLDSILRLKSSKCHEAAAEVTKTLFVGLGPIISQHLTTNLIGVLINGHPTCRDVVLKIFTSIAETDAKKLLFYHSYLMGALVYVIKYPPRQMQALMNILAIMAHIPQNIQGEENAFTAEFMILLRKQITHANIRTRCFGVLGTIAAVRQLALNPTPTNENKIDGLLALAWSSIENDEEACSIFFDEMITSIKSLPKDVCIQFRDILKMQFERLWTVDQTSDSALLRSGRGGADLQLVPTFDGNKELAIVEEGEEGGSQLIIVLEPHPLQMSPLVVPSLLRVMAEMEKASEDGRLEGIDTLIGCPVFFPRFATYYEAPDLSGLNYNQRFHLGQYLVITLNYFREAVSAFVESENPELRVKVWMRLQHIVTLQKSLVKHYETFPNLPSAYGTDKNMTDAGGGLGGGTSGGPGFSGGALQGRKPGPAKKKVVKPKKAPKPKKKGGKRKRKGEEEEDVEEEEETLRESESDPDHPHPNRSLLPLNKETTDLEERIQPKFISSYIRRLDPKVFSLLLTHPLTPGPPSPPLDYPTILRHLSKSTQCPETMAQIQSFSPETLSLILSEMKRQAVDKGVDFKLLSIPNLPATLCAHVDTIADFYGDSSQLDEDGEPETRIHSPPLDSALRLLFKCLNLYFESVAKVKDRGQRAELVDEVISTLYARARTRTNSEEWNNLTQDSMALKHVAEYLFTFSQFVGEEDYETALEHVKIMKTLHDLLPRPVSIKKAIELAIKRYLRREWKLPSAAITSFLKTWLAVAEPQMKVVSQLADRLLLDDLEPGEQPPPKPCTEIPNNSVYKCCNKANFHTWYSTMMAGLAAHVTTMGKKKSEQDFHDLIHQWSKANYLFQTLVHVSTKLKKAVILIPLLKYSRLYIQAFINTGVVLLPGLWKEDFQEGQAFTKTLQNSTRKIQNVCEHSKIVKDTILLRNVPMMKKTLETLIFKVREALGSEGVTTGFWMGSLKLRNLEGKVIGSQPFQGSDIEEEEEESQQGSGETENPEEPETEEVVTEEVDLAENIEEDEAEVEEDEEEMYLGTDEEED